MSKLKKSHKFAVHWNSSIVLKLLKKCTKLDKKKMYYILKF